MWELNERLGFGKLIEQHLTGSRRGQNKQFPLTDLLRQSVYSRLVGYEDVNDAEYLSQDPTFRLSGSEKIWEHGAALTSKLQSFETELLLQEENPQGLAMISRELIARGGAIDTPQRIVLDMDLTEISANDSLERDIAEFLRRPVGRWSHKPVVGLLSRRRSRRAFGASTSSAHASLSQELLVSGQAQWRS